MNQIFTNCFKIGKMLFDVYLQVLFNVVWQGPESLSDATRHRIANTAFSANVAPLQVWKFWDVQIPGFGNVFWQSVI